MSDNPSEQEEPSIEEILASIRQIISDDDDEATPDTKKEKVVEDPIQHERDDVLELTDSMVEEEPDVEEDLVEIDMRDIEEEEPEPEIEEPEVAYEPEPEPEPIMQERPAAVTPSDILSSSTQGAALSSLTKLTSKMPVNNSRSYDGVTLEDIVRELLHPMLREWMDDNLPPMVERLVQKELEKLTRRALDD